MQIFGVMLVVTLHKLMFTCWMSFSLTVYFPKEGPLQKHIHFSGNSECWYGHQASQHYILRQFVTFCPVSLGAAVGKVRGHWSA